MRYYVVMHFKVQTIFESAVMLARILKCPGEEKKNHEQAHAHDLTFHTSNCKGKDLSCSPTLWYTLYLFMQGAATVTFDTVVFLLFIIIS